MAATDHVSADYRVITETVGLLDRSERGRLALTGSGALEFLAGQVTNDTMALGPGEGCYAAFLTHKGKMRGDLRVLAADREVLLDCERPVLQALFDMIRTFKLGFDVELHKRTLERSLLSLVGPAARVAAGADGLPTSEHTHVLADIAERPVRLIATDVGVDVLCLPDHRDTVWAALVARGAVPVDEAAVETLRIERGRPRYGLDLDETVIPQEADLNARAVSFTKGCYVGQETVARLFYKGKPNRHLRGLRLSEPVATGTPLRLGEKEVGRVGSVTVSPGHGPIALGIVRREAEPGAVLQAGSGGATATVGTLPF